MTQEARPDRGGVAARPGSGWAARGTMGNACTHEDSSQYAEFTPRTRASMEEPSPVRLMLRRDKELGEAEWSALSAYTATAATPDSGRSSAPSTSSPSTANDALGRANEDRRDEEQDAPPKTAAAVAGPSEVAIEMPPMTT